MRDKALIRTLKILSTFMLAPWLAAAPAQGADKPLKGVTEATYTEWPNCWDLDASDSGMRAVVVPAIGGRVIHYSLDGENIIFEPKESAGKTILNTKDNFWAGGYQCDIGPELRYLPNHRSLWMGPWAASAPRDYSVNVMSEPDKELGVQMSKNITMDPESGELGIAQTMKNTSAKDVSYCLWDRTLSKGGGFVLFPLNSKSRFGAKWSLRRTVQGKYMYDGATPESPNVKIIKGVLVAHAEGPATKVGADSDAGWIAYVRGKLLFVKFFPYISYGNYSDGGNSVEAYWDERVAELEPLSPERTLKPGESYTFPEKWMLIELPNDVITFEQAREQVKRIPKFKF